MKKHETCCKNIANKNLPIATRKKYIGQQVGSGLITSAISILAPIIAGAIANAAKK